MDTNVTGTEKEVPQLMTLPQSNELPEANASY